MALMPVRAPQVLTALGPSAPVLIDLGAFSRGVTPSIFAIVSNGAVLTAIIEVCCDQPNDAGYLPSPGLWLPNYGLFNGVGTTLDIIGGTISTSRLGFLNLPVTAVRANVLSNTGGSLTFGVVQGLTPAMHMIP